jgi:hypothetical protein
MPGESTDILDRAVTTMNAEEKAQRRKRHKSRKRSFCRLHPLLQDTTARGRSLSPPVLAELNQGDKIGHRREMQRLRSVACQRQIRPSYKF